MLRSSQGWYRHHRRRGGARGRQADPRSGVRCQRADARGARRQRWRDPHRSRHPSRRPAGGEDAPGAGGADGRRDHQLRRRQQG